MWLPSSVVLSWTFTDARQELALRNSIIHARETGNIRPSETATRPPTIQTRLAPRQIPHSAGENAEFRDDAFGMTHSGKMPEQSIHLARSTAGRGILRLRSRIVLLAGYSVPP